MPSKTILIQFLSANEKTLKNFISLKPLFTGDRDRIRTYDRLLIRRGFKTDTCPLSD